MALFLTLKKCVGEVTGDVLGQFLGETLCFGMEGAAASRTSTPNSGGQSEQVCRPNSSARGADPPSASTRARCPPRCALKHHHASLPEEIPGVREVRDWTCSLGASLLSSATTGPGIHHWGALS